MNKIISTKFILMGCILSPFMRKLIKFSKNLLRLYFLPDQFIKYGATDDQIFTIFFCSQYFPEPLTFKFCKVPCKHAHSGSIYVRRVNVAKRKKRFLSSLLCLQKSTSTGLICLYRMRKLG